MEKKNFKKNKRNSKKKRKKVKKSQSESHYHKQSDRNDHVDSLGHHTDVSGHGW